MALDTILQLLMPMIGLILAVVIFTLWMFFDMIANEKISGGMKFLLVLLFIFFSVFTAMIYFFAYKRKKLLTFFIFLVIAVILTIGGWLII